MICHLRSFFVPTVVGLSHDMLFIANINCLLCWKMCIMLRPQGRGKTTPSLALNETEAVPHKNPFLFCQQFKWKKNNELPADNKVFNLFQCNFSSSSSLSLQQSGKGVAAIYLSTCTPIVCTRVQQFYYQKSQHRSVYIYGSLLIVVIRSSSTKCTFVNPPSEFIILPQLK